MNRIRNALSGNVVAFVGFVVFVLVLILVLGRGPRGRRIPVYCGVAYDAARSWSDTLLVDVRIPPTRSNATVACGFFRKTDSLMRKHR